MMYDVRRIQGSGRGDEKVDRVSNLESSYLSPVSSFLLWTGQGYGRTRKNNIISFNKNQMCPGWEVGMSFYLVTAITTETFIPMIVV